VRFWYADDSGTTGSGNGKFLGGVFGGWKMVKGKWEMGKVRCCWFSRGQENGENEKSFKKIQLCCI